MITIGSLFSGIGGIEIGLERSGEFKTEWFVEWEPFCQEVLRKHWPKATIYGDITKIDWNTVKAVDVLTGGFPCQDISNAGKRKGITGERSGLWKEYVRAISVLRPKVVFAENVSALRGRGLSTVLADLSKVGYDAEWHCLPANAVGAPHRRDRIFIIAYLDRGGQRAGNDNRERRHVCSVEVGQASEDKQEWSGRQSWTNQNDSIVADSDCRNVETHRERANGEEVFGTGQDKPSKSSSAIPDTSCAGRERGTEGQQVVPSWRQERVLRQFRDEVGKSQWETEPDLCRVVNGISRGLDSYIWRERIKALGNAVVPQCAQFFAQRIREIIKVQRVL